MIYVMSDIHGQKRRFDSVIGIHISQPGTENSTFP